MTTVLALVLFALAGILVGGAWSMYRQGARKLTVGLLVLLAALALAGGILRLWPGGDG